MRKSIWIVLGVLFMISSTFAAMKSAVDSANFLASNSIIVDQSSSPELYELDKQIQRQAIMKVVMKLSGRNVPNECRGDFADVAINDWPCKYIEAALDVDYIARNDAFRPYDNLTKTEAMKLVLRSKGIQKIEETSQWQKDYMETAHHYGIIEEKYTNYNDFATRGWIFQIATATIEKEDEIQEMGGIVSEDDSEIPDEMSDDELDDFLDGILN